MQCVPQALFPIVEAAVEGRREPSTAKRQDPVLAENAWQLLKVPAAVDGSKY